MTPALSTCLAALVVAGLSASGPATAQSSGPCGLVPLQDEGPFDYRIQHPRMKMMEGFHFTPKVEALISGQSEVSIAVDLEFVLRYTPNHHRALAAFQRLAEREKSPRPRDAMYTVQCHFERAVLYKPDDAVARVMFADYLLKTGRQQEGMQHLELAKSQQADNPFTQYNIGLVYLGAGKLDLALEQAHKAEAMGFPRTELRDKLKAAGRWVDAAPAKAAESPPVETKDKP
jgi:tetratricopeptide (TPR) repeat protein